MRLRTPTPPRPSPTSSRSPSVPPPRPSPPPQHAHSKACRCSPPSSLSEGLFGINSLFFDPPAPSPLHHPLVSTSSLAAPYPATASDARPSRSLPGSFTSSPSQGRSERRRNRESTRSPPLHRLHHHPRSSQGLFVAFVANTRTRRGRRRGVRVSEEGRGGAEEDRGAAVVATFANLSTTHHLPPSPHLSHLRLSVPILPPSFLFLAVVVFFPCHRFLPSPVLYALLPHSASLLALPLSPLPLPF